MTASVFCRPGRVQRGRCGEPGMLRLGTEGGLHHPHHPDIPHHSLDVHQSKQKNHIDVD